MMKKQIALLLTLCLYTGLCLAQNSFVVEGQVDDYKQGMMVRLYQIEGDVGSCIAWDTLHDGRFRLEVPADSGKVVELDLLITEGTLHSGSLFLWATAGTHVKTSGKAMMSETWQVESNMPLQQSYLAFRKGREMLIDQRQQLMLENNRLKQEFSRLRSSLSGEELMATRNLFKGKSDSIDLLIDAIRLKEDSIVLQIMKTHPVDRIYLMQLKSLALGVKLMPDHPYKATIIQHYEALSAADKQSDLGQAIQAYLYPPVEVKEGEAMPDADLYDLEGKPHHLSELKGRYLLLDFWSMGCGPCIAALPEMKELQQQYADRVAIVSLSIDTKANWEKASRTHSISWFNWSDLRESHGLYARYGGKAIPFYVLVSPEGKILSIWKGYGKGSLKEKLRQLLPGDEKPEN